MSLTEISVRVAVVTVLAVAALVAIGWRRPAPQYPPSSRGPKAHNSHGSESRNDDTEDHAEGARIIRRSAARRVLDVLGLGSIAAFIGILVALTVSMAIAWMVSTLLDRL